MHGYTYARSTETVYYFYSSFWLGHAISYDEEPYYSSAIMMTRLIEFNDTANTGKMDSKENLKHIRTYDLVNFDWKRVVVENSKDRVAIQVGTTRV